MPVWLPTECICVLWTLSLQIIHDFLKWPWCKSSKRNLPVWFWKDGLILFPAMDIYIHPELCDMNNLGCIYTSWNKTFLSLFGHSKNRHKLYDGHQEAHCFIEKLLTNLQRAHIPKGLVCFQVKNKMALRPCRYTSEEVWDEVFTDPASDFDDESSSNESEEYSP